MRDRMQLVPMVVERSERGERSYDIYCGCCASASSFSTAKSMTPYRRWSARNCCSWNRKTRRSRSICTSTRQAESFPAAWRCTTRCNTSAPVHTLCMGTARSMGSFLLMAGEPGHRGVGQCQPARAPAAGRVQGQASDIFIHAEEMQRTKQRITRLYAQHCGRSVEEVEQTLDRDRFMSAEQACEWGLIDQVLVRRDAHAA